MRIITKLNMRKLDLNLLLVFDALMQERNLTRAGYRLGISQPAMSQMLSKLRQAFGDPLFVRVPSGMEPTNYAKQMATSIHDGVDMLKQAINNDPEFDPLHCDRTFKIIMSDLGEFLFLPRLLERLADVAPHVGIRVLQLPRSSYQDAFLAGEADLAVGFLPGLTGGFYQQRLFQDHYLALVRSDHSRVRSTLSLEQFQHESHLMIEPVGSQYNGPSVQSSCATLFEHFLDEKGLQRPVKLRLPHFTSAPEMVRTSQLIASLPGSMLALVGSAPGLRVVPLPFKAPRFEVKQFWHRLTHHDAANRWLRGIVAELFTR